MRSSPSLHARARLFAWALGAASALRPAVARASDDAQGQALRLSWVREEPARSCPDARALARRVRARLGRDPFSDSAGTAAEVVVKTQGDELVARIQIRASDGALRGERTITSDGDCETLVAAVALAIALYIDPTAALAPHASEGSAPVAAPPAPPTPPTPPVPTAIAAAPPIPDPPPPVPRPWRGALSAGVFVSAGLLPGVGPGTRLGAELRPAARLRLMLTGALLPETRTDDGRFGFGLGAGGAGACADVVMTPLVELAPCLALLAGEIHAVVYTLEPTHPGGRFWAGAAALGRVRFHLLPHVFVELSAGAWAPFVRYRFEVSGRSEQVFQEPALAPVVDLGVGTAFP